MDAINFKINSDPSDAIEGMRKAKASVKDFGSQSNKAFNKAIKTTKTLTSALGKIGSTLGKSIFNLKTALGALASGLIFKNLIDTSAAFEKSMSGVKAVTRATQEEIKIMSEVAKDLGSKTAFSATQAGEAMEFLGRAGFKTSDIIKSIPATLDLAAAGGLELARAADIASNVLTGFNLKADQMGRVSDVMAAAAASANTDIEQLGEGMKFVAPVAAGLNVSLEEATAAMGKLSDAGLQGSLAGTGLRRVLAELESPAKKTIDIFASLGIQAEDVRVSQVGLSRALEVLKTAGLDTGQALEVFGDRGGPAFDILAKKIPELQKLTSELGNVQGRAKEMAQTKLDNLSGLFTNIKSAVEGLILKVGDSGLIKSVKGLATAFLELVRSDQTQEFAEKLGEKLGEVIDKFTKIIKDSDRVLSSLKKLSNFMGSSFKVSFELAKATLTGFQGIFDGLITVVAKLAAMLLQLAIPATFITDLTGVTKGVNTELRELIKLMDGFAGEKLNDFINNFVGSAEAATPKKQTKLNLPITKVSKRLPTTETKPQKDNLFSNIPGSFGRIRGGNRIEPTGTILDKGFPIAPALPDRRNLFQDNLEKANIAIGKEFRKKEFERLKSQLKIKPDSSLSIDEMFEASLKGKFLPPSIDKAKDDPISKRTAFQPSREFSLKQIEALEKKEKEVNLLRKKNQIDYQEFILSNTNFTNEEIVNNQFERIRQEALNAKNHAIKTVKNETDLAEALKNIDRAKQDAFNATLQERLDRESEFKENLTNLSNERLLTIINDEQTIKDTRLKALDEFKSRNLSTMESVRAGLAQYRLQQVNTSTIIANATINAFKSMESSLSNSIFAMIKGTQSFGDSIKNVFQSILDSFIQMVAQMIAQWLTLQAITAIEGIFHTGGVIPGDGLFLGRTNEGVLTPQGVANLGGPSILEKLNSGTSLGQLLSHGGAGNSIFGLTSQGFLGASQGVGPGFIGPLAPATGFQQFGTNVIEGLGSFGGAVGGFLGGTAANFLNSALFGNSTAVSIGGTGGSLLGSIGAAGLGFGPVGIGVAALVGGLIGGGIGSLFGGTKLGKSELEIGALIESIYKTQGVTQAQALGLARLQKPNTGSDNIADVINEKYKGFFPGTGHLRDDGFEPESVNWWTVKGFNELINDGIKTRNEIQAGLTHDLVVFADRFKTGLDFVPYDDFPALLHRGERVLTAEENREFNNNDNSKANQKTEALLEAILQSLNENEENTEIVVKLDFDTIGNAIYKRSKSGYQIIHKNGLATA